MEKVSNDDIGGYIGKATNTVKGWTSKFPELYELVKLGAFCKKNNLNEEKITKLVNFKNETKKNLEKVD